MSKPILIIRFPTQAPEESIGLAKNEFFENPLSNDYHVLIIQDSERYGEMLFECYNSPHTEIEFKELQDMVNKLMIKKPKNEPSY